MNLEQITFKVCGIAREAGAYLVQERKCFRQERVEEKQSHDYVSYVDKETEKKIVRVLDLLLPEAGFVTEEGTIQKICEYNWVIDPLDGTTNFIHDYTPYCVSIALCLGEEILLGVVYDPGRDECFYAWQGGGAWLNNRRLQVSDHSIERAFVGLDLPYDAETYKPILLHLIDQLYGRVTSLRISGSAALSLCYVAAGRYDGWLEAFIKLWDFAAAVLIIREAGGKVTTFSGKEDLTSTHHLIATNGLIHGELQSLVPAMD